ncbi:DUF1801 domain-containing protein [Virgibacillus sp. LDC-1]|uniref:DUF1801 domain-containing protein n=1 Tax=Virgibacillus sp. LDC-1 TaxID=3039856 RepID=UPI0024DED0A4|nr:DUF1801 domain-containing protein [Virgibacillus sp. LDC-1]
MYDQKTQETDNSVIEFIENGESIERREEAYMLIDVFSEVTGYDPKMWRTGIIGFGKYNYYFPSGHEGEAPLVGFSPRKAKIGLYIEVEDIQCGELLKQLGPYTVGKYCMYINKVEDIHLDTLKAVVKRSVANLQEKHPHGD